LTVYYFDRYPVDIPLDLTTADAEFALRIAEEVLAFVEEVISSA